MGAREEPFPADPVAAIYPLALPQVYGYLLPRCGSTVVAEDLTAETFMAAVVATRQGNVHELTVACPSLPSSTARSPGSPRTWIPEVRAWQASAPSQRAVK